MQTGDLIASRDRQKQETAAALERSLLLSTELSACVEQLCIAASSVPTACLGSESAVKALSAEAAQECRQRQQDVIANLQSSTSIPELGRRLATLGNELASGSDMNSISELEVILEQFKPVLTPEAYAVAREDATSLAWYLQTTIDQQLDTAQDLARQLDGLEGLQGMFSLGKLDLSKVVQAGKALRKARLKMAQARTDLEYHDDEEVGLSKEEAKDAVRSARQAVWDSMAKHSALLDEVRSIAVDHFPELLPELAAEANKAAGVFASLGSLLKNRRLDDYDHSVLHRGRIYKATVWHLMFTVAF